MRNHVLVCLALLSGAATGLAQTKNARLTDLQIVSTPSTSVAVTPSGYPLIVPSEGSAVSITVDLDGMRYTGYVHHSGRVRTTDMIVGDPIEAHLAGRDIVVTAPSGKQVKVRLFRRERLPATPQI